MLLRTVFALTLREMSTTYGRSPGGYIWAFVEPIGGIALLSIVFALISHTPPLGRNFPLFFASGLLPFMMYQSTAVNVGQAIRFSKPLLTYPRVTYVDAIVARFALNALTQIVIASVTIVGIVLSGGLRFDADIILCARAAAMAFALGLGVGVVNCYLMSAFPVWQFVWAVLNRPLFVVSGIFFLIDPLPQSVRAILLGNPVAHVIMRMRSGLYPNYDGGLTSELFVYLVSLCLLALGVLLLHRSHWAIVDDAA